MNELQVFTNGNFGEVRGIEINGESYLVGKDVVTALGYDCSQLSYSKYIKKYCEEEDYILLDSKTQVQFGLQFDYKILGQRGGYLINESGLYALVFNSKLPLAKKFKHWVTSEVLPSIRKHGAYMTDEVLEKTLENPDFMIGLLQNLKQERLAREEAENKLEVQKPIYEFGKAISSNDEANIDMGQMAKVLNSKSIKIGRNRLFELLRDQGILMANNNPYQKYIDNGCFTVIETTKGEYIYTKTLVTGKGQEFVYRIVKSYFDNSIDMD